MYSIVCHAMPPLCSECDNPFLFGGGGGFAAAYSFAKDVTIEMISERKKSSLARARGRRAPNNNS